MTAPGAPAILAALEATWPAAARHRVGPWTIREGRGGGSRVSAATADGPWRGDDIAEAEDAMADLGQRALFMVRADEGALDAALAARGYAVLDPVNLYLARAGTVAGPLHRTYRIWPPIAAQADIWRGAGIGPDRLAVMDRAGGPKTAILGRIDEDPAGVAFVAVHGAIAMLHALEVAGGHRRRGLGSGMLGACGAWAAEHGAIWLALAVTVTNDGANALYLRAGMRVAGGYHYRRAGFAGGRP